MGVDIYARRLTRAQTHSQPDSLALTHTHTHALSLSHTDLSSSFAWFAPPRMSARPHAVRGPIGSAAEHDIHNCGIHNCMWLGPSPGYCFLIAR
eukprot:1198589-Pyramimonas_sp.AAC.1